MGPMFYLVQCDGELLPISAVLLADWPHGFAPAPSLEKRARGGCLAWLDAFSAGAEGWGAVFRENGGSTPDQNELCCLVAFSSSQAGGSRDLVWRDACGEHAYSGLRFGGAHTLAY